MWDVAGDIFDSMDDIGILGIVDLFLDEPDLEAVVFNDDDAYGVANEEDDIIES